MTDTTSLIQDERAVQDYPQSQEEKIDDRVFFALQQKAGDFGKYQKITTAIWCIVGYLCGGFLLITPYLFYQDPYTCNQTYEQSCFDHVCSLEQSQRGKFIPTPSMYTLANKFGDYRCPDSKFALDEIQTMMYVGVVIGFLALTLVGDLVGRKLLMTVCLSLFILGMIITMFCVSIQMAGVGLFLCSVGISNGFNVCFYFLSETVSQKFREKMSVAIQLFYGLGVLINVFWYFAIKDWQLIFAICYFIPTVTALICVIIIVRDTPICLVMRNDAQTTFEALKYIAKMNKITDFKVKVGQIKSIKSKYSKSESTGSTEKKAQKRFSILDLFKFKSLRGMTLMLILLQCTIIFQFYAPALMLDQFKLNIFINGLVIGVSEIIAYPVCYFLIMKSRRQYIAYACFAATFVCSVILTFIWNQGDQNPDVASSIGVLALIFVFRFAISLEYTFFYVYFNECYPTQIRVIGTSLVSVMGGIVVTIAPEIIDACISGGFPIMILFAVLSGLSALCSYKLPETFQKTPPDVIQELRIAISNPSLITNPEDSVSYLKDPLLKEKSTNYSSNTSDEAVNQNDY